MKPLPPTARHTNGGKRCDMASGPCSCGAWHGEGDELVQGTTCLKCGYWRLEVSMVETVDEGRMCLDCLLKRAKEHQAKGTQ